MSDTLDRILDNAVLLKLGNKVVAIIRARNLRGEYLPGSTDKGYSTKDAGMPYGGLVDRIGSGKASALLKQLEQGDEKTVWKNSKSGKIWILLKGGYKHLRELAGKTSDRVTMNWTGSMMRSLQTKTDEAQQRVVIYFSNEEAGRIAKFQHEGAGKNKIKRMFMGLTEKEIAPLQDWLGEEIAKKLRFSFKEKFK
jgi:hypothetical protein